MATVREFYQVFEIAKLAYSPSVLKKPKILEKKLYDILYQITDELVIMNRADELHLVVSDEDLDREIQAIKADYPDDTFDQILIEQSVPYGIWKERLRIRLIMEKVIKKELVDGQVLSTGDISAFWETRRNLEQNEAGEKNVETEAVENIIDQLRRKKAQELYQAWIGELRNRYTIYVDQELWGKIIR